MQWLGLSTCFENNTRLEWFPNKVRGLLCLIPWAVSRFTYPLHGDEIMNTKIKSTHDETTSFEKSTRNRWGDYSTEVEKQAILKANDLAGKPTTALEIGCDGGRWSMLLAKLGWKIICTDINRDALDICQRRIPIAKCILVSPNDSMLPCETASIGLLLCIGVDPVIHSDWFIHEASRVLIPGGVLVGDVSNSFSHRAVAYRFISVFDSERRRGRIAPNLYKFSYRKWKKQVIQTGFNIAYEQGYRWLPFSNISDFFLIPQLAQFEHKIGLRHLTIISPRIVFIAQTV
jgi:ubiquinone/menaquinone biosynthesis C-methylase UbiE